MTRRWMMVVGIALAVLDSPAARAQQGVPTPRPEDVPQAVPGQISLAGDAQPDISRFLSVRSASAPSLSPDGKQLAFRTDISGTPQLWVVSASGGWPRQLTFGESVTEHQWSPDGAWLLYATDRAGNEREGYYLIRPDGSAERELLAPQQAFRSFGGFSRDGRAVAYATTGRSDVEYDIHRIEVSSGADRELLRGRMGLTVAAWRPDGGALLLSEARGEDANDVHLLDLASGKLETLFQPEQRASYRSFAWTPDGRGFYLVSDQDRDLAGLAFYDVAAKRFEYRETPEHEVEEAALSPDGRLLAWITNEGGYSALTVRDVSQRGGKALPAPVLPRGIYNLQWAAAAPVAAITVRGPATPGDIWVWNAADGALRRATESADGGLDLARMVVPEAVEVPARDGEMLHGLFYAPPGAAPGSVPPVLIGVHGGPSAQARPSFQASHQYLLARGIAVLDLNYRGSLGFGKRYAQLNDRRLREGEYLDMADALDWLGKQGRADAARAAVMGGSYGGYLTMAALTRLPDRFRAGVAFVGVSNWVTALQGASPELKASDRIEYGDIDDPADREFFRTISPLTHVAGVRAPAMVLHGANDPRDPVTESDQFVRGIREHGGEVEYLRFPDEGHGIRKLSNRIIAYRRIAAFLERTLGPGGARLPEQPN